MMLSTNVVSISLIVAGLATAACTSSGSRPAATPTSSLPPPAVTRSDSPASPAIPARPANRAADLNRSLFSRATPPGEEADLPLGPGDLIEVSVFDIPELSNLKLRIPLSGSVALPLIGSLPAAGLTATDLKDGIRTRLQQQYMHDPQVSVFVQEHKSQRISVTGAVRRGGVFPLSSRLRLADALGMAEGLAEDAGFIVYVHRRVGTERVMTTVDLERLASGEDELNLQLQAGDVIEVPRAGSFYVGGEVQKPGSFMLKSRTTVEQAIVTAGGVRDVAKWDDVRLYRAGRDGHREIVKLSLDEFENGTPAPEVLKDDVIIVGKSHTKAFLYGVRDFLRFGMGATF